jgi:hypothetical protein
MKNFKFIEIVSVISLLFSKILLAIESIYGWPLSFAGYVLVSYYNYARKYTLLGTTVAGLAATSAYGWYKWYSGFHGFYSFDWVIVIITAVFGVVIYALKARKGGLMGHLQGVITLTTLSGFVFLGFKITLMAWTCLALSHILLTVFYAKDGAKYYVALQIISLIVALWKIYAIL